MMKKRLPVGIDNFKEVIKDGFYYIDKTLFIKEVLEKVSKVTLIPRPRRFGKTLNMSMLYYFFEKTIHRPTVLLETKQPDENNNAHLFKNLKITEHEDAMIHQGQYPVIFLTLKFIQESTWEKCLEKLKQIIADEFSKHTYLLESQVLTELEKKTFHAVISLTAPETIYSLSLKILTAHLKKFYNKPPIILIDEYDVPIHAGNMNNYFNEVATFIKTLFGEGMKGNENLNFAVITGVLRVAKESIFTGMNNLKVCGFTQEAYGDKFGLLENEVKTILHDYELENNLGEVRRWYNGYTSGKFKVYNPWSIINLVDNKGILAPYWVNTGSTDIIKDLIKTGSKELKNDLNNLICGEKITKPLLHDIVYSDITSNEDALWNFLFFTGYLTFDNCRDVNEIPSADFFIPNQEIKTTYLTTISSWFKTDSTKIYNEILQNLIEGNVDRFSELFTEFVMTAFSFFDVQGKEPERFYHAFVLGMVVSLSSSYEIRSNRESGSGFYDVMLIPKDRTKYGIIMEFKKVSTYRKETIELAAKKAFDQIDIKKYPTELQALGITNIIKLGLAFEGKNVLILNN